MATPKTCECGRPIRIIVRGRGPTSRRRHPVQIKDHPLCAQCFRGLVDHLRFRALTKSIG